MQLSVNGADDLRCHRRPRIRSVAADRRAAARRRLRSYRPGRCTAAGSPITAMACWRRICPATAARPARRCRPLPTWPTGPPRCSMPPARQGARLVGHSMGSLIALETAARHPDKVSGAQPDRNRGDHDGRARSAQGRGGQRPCRDRHGLDLGPRLSGRTRRQPRAGIVDASAARSACWNNAGPACCSTISSACNAYQDALAAAAKITVPGDVHSRRTRHDDPGESRQGARRGDCRMRAPWCCRAPAT